MKTRKQKKLTLNRETLRRLEDRHLSGVGGGVSTNPACGGASEWPNCNWHTVDETGCGSGTGTQGGPCDTLTTVFNPPPKN
jgi:hypothetical protein